MTFAARLRKSTHDLHERAHHSPYMQALLAGSLPLADYTRLAIQYHFIYAALEEASDSMIGDPVGRPFVIDVLRRSRALDADLAFLLGQDWRLRIAPSPATRDYVQRMRGAAKAWPGGYVAHHYTRYLGDLAGGQVVGALLRKTYGITGDGARFYDFSGLGNPAAFRRHYRALLDAAPWNEDERAQIIEETHAAFTHNIAVLDDLAAEVGLANLTAPAPEVSSITAA